MIGLFIVNFQVPPSARYIYGGVLKISPTRYLSGYILNPKVSCNTQLYATRGNLKWYTQTVKNLPAMWETWA